MGEAVLRKVGVEVHGIRMPVIRRGDDLVKMAAEHLVEAAASGYAPFTIRDRDVVGVTESLVARAQGNIVTLEEIDPKSQSLRTHSQTSGWSLTTIEDRKSVV